MIKEFGYELFSVDKKDLDLPVNKGFWSLGKERGVWYSARTEQGILT